jgi:nicotine blue oxidoreductase
MPALAAVVLVAGRSRRLGRPKAWLRLDGEALVVRVTRSSVAAGCDPVIVVAGRDGEPDTAEPVRVSAILEQALPAAARAVVQVVPGEPDGDTLASLRRGLEHLPAGAALLLWPVDCPFADAPLLARLIAVVRSRPEAVARPRWRDRHGHPVALGALVMPELARDPLPEGARTVVLRDPSRLIDVDVDDRRICDDVDTPEDVVRLGLT